LRDLETLADVVETGLWEGLMGEVSREEIGEFAPEAGADRVDEEVVSGGLHFALSLRRSVQ